MLSCLSSRGSMRNLVHLHEHEFDWCVKNCVMLCCTRDGTTSRNCYCMKTSDVTIHDLGGIREFAILQHFRVFQMKYSKTFWAEYFYELCGEVMRRVSPTRNIFERTLLLIGRNPGNMSWVAISYESPACMAGYYIGGQPCSLPLDRDFSSQNKAFNMLQGCELTFYPYTDIPGTEYTVWYISIRYT